MNLQEWRKHASRELTLPSGLTVVYNTRFTIFDLAAQGNIPQVLIGMTDKGATEIEASDMLKNMPEIIKAAEVMIRACWVDPKVSDEPTEDSIGIAEIPADDKVEFFKVVAEASGTDSAATFPTPDGRSRAVASNGQDLSLPALADPGTGSG